MAQEAQNRQDQRQWVSWLGSNVLRFAVLDTANDGNSKLVMPTQNIRMLLYALLSYGFLGTLDDSNQLRRRVDEYSIHFVTERQNIDIDKVRQAYDALRPSHDNAEEHIWAGVSKRVLQGLEKQQEGELHSHVQAVRAKRRKFEIRGPAVSTSTSSVLPNGIATDEASGIADNGAVEQNPAKKRSRSSPLGISRRYLMKRLMYWKQKALAYKEELGGMKQKRFEETTFSNQKI